VVLPRQRVDQLSVFSDSISGMNAGDLIVSAAADASAEKSPDEGVDMADEMVGLITGSLLYKANARALKTSADTDGYIFDALA